MSRIAGATGPGGTFRGRKLGDGRSMRDALLSADEAEDLVARQRLTRALSCCHQGAELSNALMHGSGLPMPDV